MQALLLRRLRRQPEQLPDGAVLPGAVLPGGGHKEEEAGGAALSAVVRDGSVSRPRAEVVPRPGHRAVPPLQLGRVRGKRQQLLIQVIHMI